MTPKQQQELEKHVEKIALILYQEAKIEGKKLESLGEIEQTVRRQVLEYISPQIGEEYIKNNKHDSRKSKKTGKYNWQDSSQ